MYCRNCGKKLTGAPQICPGCGAKPLVGSSFCPACGAKTSPLAEFCTKCGAGLGERVYGDISPKSRLAVTLLCILPSYFFCIAGIHRFYLGKIGTGILMLLTLGGLGIWTIIDFIIAVTGNMKDKEGKLIKTW
jgi:TM2 domain-containing membrane protein YozV